MCFEPDTQPCDPIEPVGPLRTDVPQWALSIARLDVGGMRCEHCATRIGNALFANPYVLGVSVSIQEGRVEVLFDSAQCTVSRLAAIIMLCADGSPRVYEVTGVSPFP